MRNTNMLLTQEDIKNEKKAYVLTWIFSNVFSLLFPILAVLLAKVLKGDGFDPTNYYSEFLMVTISICMNLIIQLNSKDYKIKEWANILVRVVTVGILVVSSLVYGMSKAIPENELKNIGLAFKISLILAICAFVIGIACEAKKKVRD